LGSDDLVGDKQLHLDDQFISPPRPKAKPPSRSIASPPTAADKRDIKSPPNDATVILSPPRPKTDGSQKPARVGRKDSDDTAQGRSFIFSTFKRIIHDSDENRKSPKNIAFEIDLSDEKPRKPKPPARTPTGYKRPTHLPVALDDATDDDDDDFDDSEFVYVFLD
jgi:hypothetical protein